MHRLDEFLEVLKGTGDEPPPRRKHKIERQESMPEFNSSFMTKQNMRWFTVIINWLPDPNKPLVMLPCGSGQKTRAIYGKKVISKSTSHDFMSAVTHEPLFERVIISEPLTIIPYALEFHELRPDYNLPPEALSIQSERIFINQLALWLAKVHIMQPKRQFIYYTGGMHHFFVLFLANAEIGGPFKVIYSISPGGSKGYAIGARALREMILETELTGVSPGLPMLPTEQITRLLCERGKSCSRKFWKDVIMEQFVKHEFVESVEHVTTREEAMQGFQDLYEQYVLNRAKRNKNKKRKVHDT